MIQGRTQVVVTVTQSDWFDAKHDEFRDLVRQITLDFDYGSWFVPEPKMRKAAIPTGILAKFTPVLSNLLEVYLVERLNEYNDANEVWKGHKWVNQDPYFPDCILVNKDNHDPTKVSHGVMGIEVKMWYPMATELTARMNESQAVPGLENSLLLIATWMPKKLLWGDISTIDVGIFDLLEVIRARDEKWFRPPTALITEPYDTTTRTANLQQTNVIFWELQDGAEACHKEVKTWSSKKYSTDDVMQGKIRQLIKLGSYRQENNNRNKIQRIGHKKINKFRKEVGDSEVCGKTLSEWRKFKPAKEIGPDMFDSLVEHED